MFFLLTFRRRHNSRSSAVIADIRREHPRRCYLLKRLDNPKPMQGRLVSALYLLSC
jgi:hypothetical protein